MFNAKPRPVPSKAALRVLYQLAYISSGTAVGVGVLCTEERRRQIKLVQRIADNAKLIRQSPRYHGHAALAAADTEHRHLVPPGWESVQSSLDNAKTLVGEQTAWGVKGGDTQYRQSDRCDTIEDSKGPELPSVVSAEYAKTQETRPGHRQRHSRRRRVGTNDAASEGRSEQRLGQPRFPRERSQLYDNLHRLRERAERTMRFSNRGEGSTWGIKNESGGQIAREKPRSIDTEPNLSTHAPTAHEEDDSVSIDADLDPPSEMDASMACLDAGFRNNLQQKQLDQCAESLAHQRDHAWPSNPQNHAQYLANRENFLVACSAANRHDLMIPHFTPLDQFSPQSLEGLSCESLEMIANACSRLPQFSPPAEQLFLECFQRSSEVVRGSLTRARTSARLKEVWQRTRQIHDATEELHAMSAWLRMYRRHNVEERRRLGLAAVEIYVEGSRPDLASKAASSFGITGAPVTSVIATTVAIARQGNWKVVDQLLLGARKSPDRLDRALDARVYTLFEELVQLHADSHDSEQTFEFVADAFQRLGIQPSAITTLILLESFVRKKTLNQVPRWLDYLDAAGHKFPFSATTARKVLSAYYQDQRPPQSVLVGLCYNLVVKTPLLNLSHFSGLMADSLAYDARTIFTNEEREHRIRISKARLLTLKQSLIQARSVPHLTQVTVPGSVDANRTSEVKLDGEGNRHIALHDMNVDAPATAPRDTISSGNPDKPTEQTYVRLLSHGRYTGLLKLYHATYCGQQRLLPSMRILEIAIQASLRRDLGNMSEAQNILAQAESAGMDVTTAAVTLLLHRIRSAQMRDPAVVEELFALVTKHYKTYQQRRLPVNHYVATTAAHHMIVCGHAAAGVRLLNDVCRSDAAAQLSTNLVVLTVLLRGNQLINSGPGIVWVIQQALDQRIRVDQRFLTELAYSKNKLRQRLGEENGLVAVISEGHRVLMARRLQDKMKTAKFGDRLVEILATYVNRSAGEIEVKRGRHSQESVSEQSAANGAPQKRSRPSKAAMGSRTRRRQGPIGGASPTSAAAQSATISARQKKDGPFKDARRMRIGDPQAPVLSACPA